MTHFFTTTKLFKMGHSLIVKRVHPLPPPYPPSPQRALTIIIRDRYYHLVARPHEIIRLIIVRVTDVLNLIGGIRNPQREGLARYHRLVIVIVLVDINGYASC